MSSYFSALSQLQANLPKCIEFWDQTSAHCLQACAHAQKPAGVRASRRARRMGMHMFGWVLGGQRGTTLQGNKNKNIVCRYLNNRMTRMQDFHCHTPDIISYRQVGISTRFLLRSHVSKGPSIFGSSSDFTKFSQSKISNLWNPSSLAKQTSTFQFTSIRYIWLLDISQHIVLFTCESQCVLDQEAASPFGDASRWSWCFSWNSTSGLTLYSSTMLLVAMILFHKHGSSRKTLGNVVRLCKFHPCCDHGTWSRHIHSFRHI